MFPVQPARLRTIGDGQPLEPGIRRAMESCFRIDLSEVRVHEGSAAPSIGALAFTLGDDLHFAPGRFDPTTRDGLALLGHELAHVVQQREGRVANPYGRGIAIVQDPELEAEAHQRGERIAEQLWSGSFGAVRRAAPDTAVRRATTQRGPRGAAVQRMESSSLVVTTTPRTIDGESTRVPVIITGDQGQYCVVLVSLLTQEAEKFAVFRKALLDEMFPGQTPSILVLSEPTIFDLDADPNARALEPLYRDLGTVLVTQFELQKPLLRIGNTPVVGNSIFVDATKQFPEFVRGRDLILMRRGLCYCSNHEACCGVSRVGSRDVAFLIEVGRALSRHKNAVAILGSRLATINDDQVSYKSWSAAAAEAMTQDPYITIAVVCYDHPGLGLLFVGLHVTYDPAHGSNNGPSFVDLRGRVSIDLSYDKLARDTHPELLDEPTFTNGKLNL